MVYLAAEHKVCRSVCDDEEFKACLRCSVLCCHRMPAAAVQGQQPPWGCVPGADASTPGSLLYHDRTPASPVNMLLLSRQPAGLQDAQAQSSDMPPPPPAPGAGSDTAAGVARGGGPAGLPSLAAQALPPPPSKGVAVSVVAKGEAQAQQGAGAKKKGSAAGVAKSSETAASEGAQISNGAAAPRQKRAQGSNSTGCLPQQAPAKRPRGKGFAGLPAPTASPQSLQQPALLSNGVAKSFGNETQENPPPKDADKAPAEAPLPPTELPKSPQNKSKPQPAPGSSQPENGADNPKSASELAPTEPCSKVPTEQQQRPAENGPDKEPQAAAAADKLTAGRQQGTPRQSPELEASNVRHAVQV